MFFPAINFWQKLLQWDRSLFVQINSNWTNPVFDAVMPLLRTPIYWVPLYLFILVFVSINFRSKAIWWIVFFLVTVALTDMTGTRLFKYNFVRIRPCNDPDLIGHVRLLVLCPSGYGFTSNHAANHFGMATFLFFTFRHLFKKWMWIAFLWAGSIAYSQVYVGIHYPGDIICGALMGITFGVFTAFLFNKYFGPMQPERSHT
jgi:membrane-associated phospholipid phosphatase